MDGARLIVLHVSYNDPLEHIFAPLPESRFFSWPPENGESMDPRKACIVVRRIKCVPDDPCVPFRPERVIEHPD